MFKFTTLQLNNDFTFTFLTICKILNFLYAISSSCIISYVSLLIYISDPNNFCITISEFTVFVKPKFDVQIVGFCGISMECKFNIEL
ncbi:hypothetical protein MrNuV_ORF054 [Macrobrachium rosenbergii nudivirus]|nr:hypothetical protein MrNuV_ORF054 [Macrobrachium rosenbergii nudivirus]